MWIIKLLDSIEIVEKSLNYGYERMNMLDFDNIDVSLPLLSFD